MASSYFDRYQNSQDGVFQARVGVAATRVAIQYTNEQAPNITVDRKRRALAMVFLGDPIGNTQRIALALASQEVTLADPDEVLQIKVYQLWDGLAGIFVDDWGTNTNG